MFPGSLVPWSTLSSWPANVKASPCRIMGEFRHCGWGRSTSGQKWVPQSPGYRWLSSSEILKYFYSKKRDSWEFPGGLLVRNWCFRWGGLSSVPGQGTIPHAVQGGQNAKKIKIKNLEKRILIEYFQPAISKLTVKFFILNLNTFKGYNLKHF